MKKVTTIIIIITVSLFFSCYFDGIRENANDPKSSNYQYYFYTTQWGSYGSGNGQFNSPEGIAIDSIGNVYVADSGNYRVQKFSSSGSYITQWGSYGTGDGQFSVPKGIAVDSDNNVYVVDSGYNRVQKFTSSGVYLSQWWSSYPNGIAIDSDDNVYVTDSENNRIQKFDSNGTYITQWGSEGSDNGQFNTIGGIAVDSNDNVYVSDYYYYYGCGSSRVQKFTSIGGYITQWGTCGSRNVQFICARGIAIDSDDNVYAADSYYFWDSNNRVQKITSSGSYVTQWGSYGQGNGQFICIGGIAVDSSWNVYVTDSGNNWATGTHRVQKFHYRPRP